MKKKKRKSNLFAACVCSHILSVDTSDMCRNVKHSQTGTRWSFSSSEAQLLVRGPAEFTRECEIKVVSLASHWKHLQIAHIPGPANRRESSILLPNPRRNAQHAGDGGAGDTCTPSRQSVTAASHAQIYLLLGCKSKGAFFKGCHPALLLSTFIHCVTCWGMWGWLCHSHFSLIHKKQGPLFFVFLENNSSTIGVVLVIARLILHCSANVWFVCLRVRSSDERKHRRESDFWPCV